MPNRQLAERLNRRCAEDHGIDALYLPGWTADDWATLLDRARPVALARNEVLIKKGQADGAMYLVASGQIEVNATGGNSAMGTLFREGPGAVIGEIAFFDGGKRSATAWALEPTELLALERADIEAFAAERPARALELMFALGRVLAHRVRHSEQRKRIDAY